MYLAEFHLPKEHAVIKRLVRLQKWGVWEHLEEGKDLLQAIEESDEYTDFWLDRRLGCRQLGMNLTRRVAMHRLSEIYNGTNARFRGEMIRTIYFEREYLPGIATDKLPLEEGRSRDVALAFRGSKEEGKQKPREGPVFPGEPEARCCDLP